MATALSLQTAPKNSSLTDITMSAADVAGNTFVNDGRTMILIRNDDAAQQTVEVTQVSCSHGRTETETITVAAAGLAVKPIFPKDLYGATVTITASAVTVKVAAVRYTP